MTTIDLALLVGREFDGRKFVCRCIIGVRGANIGRGANTGRGAKLGLGGKTCLCAFVGLREIAGV